MKINKIVISTIKNLLPPILFSRLRSVKFFRDFFCNGRIEYSGDFSSWSNAMSKCSGYNSDNILSKVLSATMQVKSGSAAYERDSVVFYKDEYVWSLLASLMWAAAKTKGILNVLDFGGALGSSYFQNRRFLHSLTNVQWSVVEQANFVRNGRKFIQDDKIRFFETVDECVSENKPNVILLSSVLQYIEFPELLIEKLSNLGADTLIIDRTPFLSGRGKKLVIQNVPPSIYTASYPMWIFSIDDFMKLVEKDWVLVAKDLSPEGYVYADDNMRFSFNMMIFESKNDYKKP